MCQLDAGLEKERHTQRTERKRFIKFFLKCGEFFSCGEFLQNMNEKIFIRCGEFCSCGGFLVWRVLQNLVNLFGVVNKFETHQSAVI